MKRMNKKGFTLIELLAVIVILGILMLIAIPSVTRFINQSREKTFRSTVQMMVDSVRNDAVLKQSGDCYETVAEISLEKGDKSSLSGYVKAVQQSDNTFKFVVDIIDTKNKFQLTADETTNDKIDSVAIKTGPSAATSVTAPNNLSSCK